LAFAVNAFAQGGGSGTVTGTVVDNVGVVPGATVTLTEAATGQVRTMPTTEVGAFRFAALPPGRYSVKVEMQGFKPVDVQNFLLDSGVVRDLGKVMMTAGAMSEQVTVTANVTPVQVASTSRQASVTADQLQNIQTKGRDIYGLLAVIPGVQDANLNRDSTSWTSANNITINGAPVTSNNVMIDGIAQRDEYGTNAFVNPNIDAIAEVQVISNGFTAENGRSSGGLINFVTKSGSSQFRGSGWYNARRDSWNKNDYVRIRRGQAKPLYDVNVGGFSIGGPVILPHLIDSRSGNRKVFFFVSQEFTKDARPSATTTANLPTDLERAGDFSQTFLTSAGANYGKLQPIIDYQTGQPFDGNIIPANRINPVGQKMLQAMARPNGYVPPGANQQWNANFIDNDTPLHNRIDYVYRGDVVLTNNLRFSGKILADQENNIAVNAFGPGTGKANNTVPAWLLGGTVTYVINPTMVNEINGGFTINHYNERGYPNDYDYTQSYCTTIGVCPPRIAEYGTYYGYNAPPQNAACSGTIDGKQLDQYPYFPVIATSGGNRAALASWSPGIANGRVMPTCNHDRRFVIQDDLSKTIGRHSLKFGFYSEDDATLAPIGSTNYMGNYNFGSSANNPRDTGNGYANMLTGVVTSYSEATNRIAWYVGHWMNEGYAQDSWRVNSRLTMDYGLRVSHIGAFYEKNNSTAGFYPELFDPSQAVRIYRPICKTGVAGDVSCSAANQAAIDPADPTAFLPFQLAGTIVPDSGDYLNGMKANGYDGKGRYYHFPALEFAPRFGIAWDVNGDGRSAVRASTGAFYNFPRNSVTGFTGKPPTSYNQVVNNVTLDQIAAYSTGGGLTFTQSPISSAQVTLDGRTLGVPVTYNANLAYQRDVGFNPTVEVAYVGNWTLHDNRNYAVDVLPLYVFGDPANQFNQAALNQNYLFTKYPGLGNITDTTNDLTSLNYNAMQLSVQRRLSKGLQMGVAYTLSKAMGYSTPDEYTRDPSLTINMGGTLVQGGEAAVKQRYWGPTSVDRRHNLTVNYSYLIPTLRANKVVRAILGNWQISGVTKFLTGTAVNPSCSDTTNKGVQYSTPSLTNGVGARCVLTGEPINLGKRVDVDPANPDPLTATYFNLGAFTMATPASSTVGDFGNAALGLLRDPSINVWDVTLERRIPLRFGRNSGVRLQIQAYNLFNQVEFTSLSAGLTFQTAPGGGFTQTSSSAGQQANVMNARAIGLTLRFDF
jgi:outer membrane receptor protein involved in Fe transport